MEQFKMSQLRKQIKRLPLKMHLNLVKKPQKKTTKKKVSTYITNFHFRRHFNGKISSNIIYLFNFIIVITILVVNDDKSTEAVPKKSGLFARFSSKDKTPATPPNTPTTAVTTPNTENETQLQGMYVHNNIM